MQRAQIAAPGQPALAMSISPSQYAFPQTSLAGQLSGQDSISHIPLPIVPIAPASSRRDIIKVNLDEQLDQQDIDNLNDIKLSLPSKVYETDTISQTLGKVKAHKKSIGQYLGIGAPSKNISKDAKVALESQKATPKNIKLLSKTRNPQRSL